MLLATWFIAAASIAAVLVAVLSMRAYKLALSVDVVLKFDARFSEPNFKVTRSKAAKALLSKIDEDEAEDVFDFFDTLGLFVKLGALTDELAYSVFFHWINLYWMAGKRHIGSKQSETRPVWKNFRKISERVREIERQRDPESEDLKMPETRLHEHLQQEIDLSS